LIRLFIKNYLQPPPKCGGEGLIHTRSAASHFKFIVVGGVPDHIYTQLFTKTHEDKQIEHCVILKKEKNKKGQELSEIKFNRKSQSH
jgi:hypothetical protein